MATIAKIVQGLDYPHIHEVLHFLYPDEFRYIQTGYYRTLMERCKNSNSILLKESGTAIFKEDLKEPAGFYTMGRKQVVYPFERLSLEEFLGLKIENDLPVEQILVHLFVQWRKGENMEGADYLACVEPNQHLPYFRNEDKKEGILVQDIINSMDNE